MTRYRLPLGLALRCSWLMIRSSLLSHARGADKFTAPDLDRRRVEHAGLLIDLRSSGTSEMTRHLGPPSDLATVVARLAREGWVPDYESGEGFITDWRMAFILELNSLMQSYRARKKGEQ